MAKRGPYKQKCTIPKPQGMHEATSTLWDIMVNNPDRGERRAAKKTLRKMGVKEAANVNVDRKVPVIYPTKFKRKQTEAQKARSDAYFASKRIDAGVFTPDAPEAALALPDASVEASTVGKGFTGTFFDLPRPTLPVAPQIDTVLTLNEARDAGYAIQFLSIVKVHQYRKPGDKYWISCRDENEPPRPTPSARPDISQLYARHLTNPAQGELQQLQVKFPGNDTRIAPYGEGSRDAAQVMIDGTWVSYDWCKANGKL